MVTAGEFLNDNSISTTAFAFFTALVGGIVTVIVQGMKNKQAAREAALNANEAAKKAEEARKNTVNVSNGFVGGLDKKLEHIATAISRIQASTDRTEESMRGHLEWHLDQKETKK